MISLLDSVFKSCKPWRAELNLGDSTSEGTDIIIAVIRANAFDTLDWLIQAGIEVCDCLFMMGCFYNCRRNIFKLCKEKGHIYTIIDSTISVRCYYILDNVLRWISIHHCLESLEYLEKAVESRWKSIKRSLFAGN